jgi:hypothetical protein
VQHIAKFVEDYYGACGQNAIKLGEAIKGRGIQIAVDMHDDPAVGPEIGNEFRQSLLKRSNDELTRPSSVLGG